jgi:hypothetical protein
VTSVQVDTSVWRGSFAEPARARALLDLIEDDEALLHPFVLGELTLGGLSVRAAGDLRRLTAFPVIDHDEVMAFVAERRLARRGVGWLDANILASVLAGRALLWSFDRALDSAATDLGVVFDSRSSR